jgi:DNA-binding CsgD family transcriptional regulator/energy-coupling factor transporter ATP-binding protein EcfA2
VELLGRQGELATLDDAVRAIRAGESRVHVLSGPPGSGKTALLAHLSGLEGVRIVRAAGAQFEMELPFAGLHQLCLPLLHRLDVLPAAQRDALRVTFGRSAGRVPDRLLVGLAVLALVTEGADDVPLLCLVDDAHWLDSATAQILTFVARRLRAEPVGIVFATRTTSPDLQGFPEIPLSALAAVDADRLLCSALTAPLDDEVRAQIVAEAAGNPLAVLERARHLDGSTLAGGFGLVHAAARDPENSFRTRIASLPDETRKLVLLAAADPTGDPVLVRRAADRLALDVFAAGPAVDAGLVRFGTRVRFRHPLVRAAAYDSATPAERAVAHAALAQATDTVADPDRRAWHLAHSATGPDDLTADELERSAARAQARGGVSAAAAFMERAAQLSRDPANRARRLVAAALSKTQAGATDSARSLLAAVESGPLSEHDRARVLQVRAHLAFAASRGAEAPKLLLGAAKQLAEVDPRLSRSTYLDAALAAHFAARLAGTGSSTRDIARAVRGAVRPVGEPGPFDLLAHAWSTLFTEGYETAMPQLRLALAEIERVEPAAQELRWLSLAYGVACHLWDLERCARIATRYVELTRSAGALTESPLALVAEVQRQLFAGELEGAQSLIGEMWAANEVTGGTLAPYSELHLAALRGERERVDALTGSSLEGAAQRGEGFGVTAIEWANALLHNGLGDHSRAAEWAARASQNRYEFGFTDWAAVELVEAAARSGSPDIASATCARLAETAEVSGTEWGLGLLARCRALTVCGDRAEPHFLEAIARLGRTTLRPDLARAHLLYGEWLLGRNRSENARLQLRTAHTMLQTMGVDGFAARARQGLRAVGEVVRRPAAVARTPLTSQEAQIARLARDGMTNPEIGTRLLISSRTVQYHLKKVFVKLDITSRHQLRQVVADDVRLLA